MDKASIKKLSWNEAREQVSRVNPELAKVIDEISPPDNFGLYHVKYPYGSYIVREGQLLLPTPKGNLVKLNHPDISEQIKHDLAYAMGGMPAGFLVKHSAQECIKDIKNNSLPLAVVSPGSVFALWKWLDSTPAFHPVKVFDITAGAQSIFMLPNIGDLTSHKHLRREFNIAASPPKTLKNQWTVFKSLAAHPDLNCNWMTEVIYFSGDWIDKAVHDPAWQRFYLTLLEYAWKSSAFERNQMFYDYALSCAQAYRNLKPNPYLVDTVRHLIMIAMGSAAGFAIAKDDLHAPVSLIQDVYIEHYKLKNYIPTLFVPEHFSLLAESTDPIYYSLQIPTTLEFSPKSRQAPNLLQDLCELKQILSIFIEELAKGSLKLEDTILAKLSTDIDFNYYHTKVDPYGEIKHTQELLTTHPEICYYPKKYADREFALTGTFLRGCVQIQKKSY